MKYLIITLLTLITIGCITTKQQRRENKVVRKIDKLKEKYPDAFTDVNTETVRIDTIIKEIHLKGETKLDTITVHEFLYKYLPAEVDKQQFIEDFLETASSTIQVDSLGIHLTIEGVGVNFTLIKDEQHIAAEKTVETLYITKTEVVNKLPWWVYLTWVILVLLGLKGRFSVM